MDLDWHGGFTLKKSVLAASLGLMALGLVQAQQPAGRETLAQQAIPDAPKPQPTLHDLGPVTPGLGSSSTQDGDAAAPASGTPATPAQTQAAEPPDSEGTVATESLHQFTMHVPVNFVEIPFTVKDSKGQLVPGLTANDVRVYENGLRQHITDFTTDAFPLSVALVIDQTMTHDEMDRLNDSLEALQSAFAPFDEVAIFTYNNGPKMVTDFTGAQSARLTQAIEDSKGHGRDALLAGSLGGPMASTNVINDQNFDPNTAPQRGNSGMQLTQPREVHALNDAILAAATALSKRPIERRRVVYVISNGNEFGSVAHTKDVIHYLQANGIQVDVTLVGESSLPVVGFIDRIHLPLTMRDNVLNAYWQATGGVFDAEFRTGAIEKSFAKIASEVRNQYTLGYYTHESFLDGKYRPLELRVFGHGNDLTIIAKKGYYPAAMELLARPAAPAQ
jgi:VWFA-related protein